MAAAAVRDEVIPFRGAQTLLSAMCVRARCCPVAVVMLCHDVYCLRACVRACVLACVRACVRACAGAKSLYDNEMVIP